MELLFVNFGIAACVLLIYVTIVFVVAQALQDNSVMDIAYGPAFFVTALTGVIMTNSTDFFTLALMTAIGLWAVRLSVRIFLKNLGKPEDARYAAWREEWMQKSRLYFLVRSYLQINILQGVIILLVLTPFIIGWSQPAESLPFVSIIGFAIFLFGLIYETTADWQLDQFINRKKNGTEDATLMTKGLFKFSRRPNYFGESLVWWGLAIAVLPLPYGYLALISPIVITYIVTKVTGPMLEDIFLKKYPEEYRAYMATTNYFVPGPKKTTVASVSDSNS